MRNNAISEQTGPLARAKRSGRRFLNPVETSVGGLTLMWKLLPQYLANREETEPRKRLGPFHTDAATLQQPSRSGLRVTWFGHSSSLVEMDGVRLLIDPVWDLRAAPVTWFGPKRFFAPTISLPALGSPDAVLISHDHYDHLGKRTVRELVRLYPSLRWICPLAVGTELARFGVRPERITELDWTEETVVQANSPGESEAAELRITALPARHFSGRSLRNRFETLWAAFALHGSKHRVYYGADTGLWDGFRSIANAYGPFDLTMLEIGAFNELWASIHLGPDGAAEAFDQLGGRGLLMPIHWGLFNLALHAWRQPIERMTVLAKERNLQLFSPEPGKPTEVTEAVSNWWQAPRR